MNSRILELQLDRTLKLFAGIDEETAQYRYKPDKWSIKEVVGHIIDTERVFGHRAFSIARKEPEPLPSFNQDEYVRNANFSERNLSELSEEFQLLRKSNIAMFKGFNDEIWLRKGIASGFSFTVRTFPFILAGHENHHFNILLGQYLKEN